MKRLGSRESGLAQIARLGRRNPAAAIGVVVLVAWVIIALTVSFWYPQDPLVQDMGNRVAAPSIEHPFGTDLLGRDILARVLYGSRLSLPTGVIVVALSLVIGGAYGMVSGYAGGRIDDVMMRIAEVFLAFPSVILAMAIAAALGPSLTNAMLAMIAVWWPEFARLMRGQVLSVREYPHVDAARVIGASPLRIMIFHILPENPVASGCQGES